jgi:hypothetical protein
LGFPGGWLSSASRIKVLVKGNLLMQRNPTKFAQLVQDAGENGVLPVLAVEYFGVEEVRSNPGVALALHIGVAVIWVAFALEFILESSVAPSPFRHACDRWLDAAIVTLPMLEFVLTKWVDAAPIARLLRLGRALSPEQLGRLQQLYRLRGMMGKAWQAFLLLGGVHRILGAKPERRIRQLEEQIADLEDQIAELRQQADDLRTTEGYAGADAPRLVVK